MGLTQQPDAVATIQQVVPTPEGDQRYWIRIADGAVTVGRGDAVDPEVTISQDLGTAVALAKRELNPVTAFMTGRLKVHGDMGLLMKLQAAVSELPNAMADVDAGADHPIFLSGQALNPGRPAPRHFLSLMPASLRPVGAQGSGRLEMAEAIANPANPLTARVYVNRVWHHVFGKGLVASTDNFGRLSDPPANPELLAKITAALAEGFATAARGAGIVALIFVLAGLAASLALPKEKATK